MKIRQGNTSHEDKRLETITTTTRNDLENDFFSWLYSLCWIEQEASIRSISYDERECPVKKIFVMMTVALLLASFLSLSAVTSTPQSAHAATTQTTIALQPHGSSISRTVCYIVFISNNNNNDQTCVSKVGYNGISKPISNVTRMATGPASCGWYLAYSKGKSHQFNFGPNENVNVAYDTITQVDVTSTSCS